MSTHDRIVRHVIVRGRVQGVGYRAWIEDQAILRGLDGFVRNRADGAVEAAFAGPPGDVAGMVAACRNGPMGARVTALSDKEGSDALLAQRRPGESFSVLSTI
jgi:acylphosphatase